MAELETDSTLTSEYLMLRRLLGKVDETKAAKDLDLRFCACE